MIHDTALAAKIAARNNVHKAASDNWFAMLEALRPFVGLKVRNVTGELSKKVKAALPEIPCTVPLSGHYEANHYTLRACFKTCESAATGRDYQIAHYAEVSIALGELDSAGTLTALATPYELRTNYTAAEVIEARTALKKAQNVVSDLRGKLDHFGEYDR